MVKDSGNRREFDSGAVRDMHSGKGRCDLLPLDIVVNLIPSEHPDTNPELKNIHAFQEDGDTAHLYDALASFILHGFGGKFVTATLELACHFEDGAVKYGDNNWRKGIPANVYIDSAIRHYLKWRRGDTDERHDRAVLWNLVCCIWTCEHIPELNTYRQKEDM